MWWNKNQWKLILPILALGILVAAFTLFGGGNAKDTAAKPAQGEPSASVEMLEDSVPSAGSPTDANADTTASDNATVQAGNPNQVKDKTLEAPTMAATQPKAEASQNKHQTDAQPVGKPAPVNPQDATIAKTELNCTISISCATLVNNMDRLSKDKKDLVPSDGWILQAKRVTFYEGESVFNILQRVCKQEKIHLEFENTPIYNSSYIEGIGNLYEFDAGDLSGWMYQVNDWFPNYGCSRYQAKDGDVINWVYTCNLGDDVGGGQALKDQKS